MDLVSSDLSRAAQASDAMPSTVAAVSAFSADLYGSIAGSSGANLVCSPYSVALALGMTVQGARGSTAEQVLDVLHSTDAAALGAGLNAIDLALASRSGTIPGPQGEPARLVELASANSLWGQRGVHWQQPFLDVLARDFGTGMRVVDYAKAEAARSAINTWVSKQTRHRIPELVPSRVLTADTRLTLVNALYLKAPWQSPFDPALTRKAPFHRLNASSVSADLMQSTTATGFADGPGWRAVQLPYAKRQLAMTVVIPDTGRFAEVEKAITGEWLTGLLTGFRPEPVDVRLPRWTIRTQAGLTDVLAGLGMPVAFTEAADFSGMTSEEPLQISAVIHEGFITVDESGTEAAAATAVVMRAMGAMLPSRTVVADRPFLYLIHDLPTGTPIFVGRVLDPTA
jgi:serpin B